MERGTLAIKALEVINGERQDQYGSPEDSFQVIAEYWETYLLSKGLMVEGMSLYAIDVAMMMTLFKVARESNQHKEDNIVDAIGYLAIAGDM